MQFVNDAKTQKKTRTRTRKSRKQKHPMVQKAMESNRKVSPNQYRQNMKLYKKLIKQLFELQKKEERFNKMHSQLNTSLPAKKAIGREGEVLNRMGIYESKIRNFNNLIEENQARLRAIAPNVCSVYLMYPASQYMTLSEYRYYFTDHSMIKLSNQQKLTEEYSSKRKALNKNEICCFNNIMFDSPSPFSV